MSAVDAQSKKGYAENVETQRRKAPIPKFQAPEKLQAPNPNLVFQARLRAWFRCSLGRWCLGILWSLELGLWCFLAVGGMGRGVMECRSYRSHPLNHDYSARLLRTQSR